MKLIDTHNHLYLEEFDPEQEELVHIARESGIDTILLPNVDVATIERMHDLCDRFPDFAYPMMGLHPTSVDEHYRESKNNRILSGKTTLLWYRRDRDRPILG